MNIHVLKSSMEIDTSNTSEFTIPEKFHKSLKNRIGQVYHSLTVIALRGRRNGRVYWTVRCKCGIEFPVFGGALSTGRTKSCGCLFNLSHRGIRPVSPRKPRDPLYGVWGSIVSRCTLKTNKVYHRYGGRGITICDRWRNSFKDFCHDMGPRPEGSSIDRINNDGNYEPSNCRWASIVQQNSNTRKNVLVEFNGRTLTLSQWSRETGISKEALSYRFHKGWSAREMLTKPTKS
jgi:hypothetical protein